MTPKDSWISISTIASQCWWIIGQRNSWTSNLKKDLNYIFAFPTFTATFTYDWKLGTLCILYLFPCFFRYCIMIIFVNCQVIFNRTNKVCSQFVNWKKAKIMFRFCTDFLTIIYDLLFLDEKTKHYHKYFYFAWNENVIFFHIYIFFPFRKRFCRNYSFFIRKKY